MIFKHEKLDTRYLDGMEYHYNGKELDDLTPTERDSKCIAILIINGIKPLFKTYARQVFTHSITHSHWIIVTHNYKPAIFNCLED
jgi:hypothetical protein